jgi:hypothetical protein
MGHKGATASDDRVLRAYDRVPRDSLARMVAELKQEYTDEVSLHILNYIEAHYRLNELTEQSR